MDIVLCIYLAYSVQGTTQYLCACVDLDGVENAQ